MNLFKVFGFLLIGCAILSSCGSSKPASSGNYDKGGECRSLAYQNPSIRAWGSATHRNISHATAAAALQARGQLAAALKIAIEGGIEVNAGGDGQTFSNGNKGSKADEDIEKLNNTLTGIIDQEITNSVIIKDQVYKESDGRFLVFVTIEYQEGVAKMAEKLASRVQRQFSDEDRMRMNFEYEKFKERIEEKLKKAKNK